MANRRKRFYEVRFYNDMDAKQKIQFEKSYQSYEKAYKKLKNPYDSKLDRESYFEEYKQKRKEMISQNNTSSIAREIARDQQYERSYAQDKWVYSIIKKSDIYQTKYNGKLTLTEFRKIDSEEINTFLFGEIKAFREQALKDGKTEEEINTYIRAYYFGSP